VISLGTELLDNMKPQEVLLKEAFVLIQAAKYLTNELDPVIDLIVENKLAGRHLIISGVGKNRACSEKMAASLSSLGIPSFFLCSYEMLHGSLGSIIKDQVMIGLSKSGETQEILQAFDAAGRFGAKLISIVCKNNSSLGKIVKSYNGLDIYVPCQEESDLHNLAPTSSSTLLMAIGDAIGCVASEKLKFSKEDFLRCHPQGSLGKQLRSELGR
jgi:arabinose-5-phosphate isomerase